MRYKIGRRPHLTASHNLETWQRLDTRLAVAGSADFDQLVQWARGHKHPGGARGFITYCIRQGWIVPVDSEKDRSRREVRSRQAASDAGPPAPTEPAASQPEQGSGLSDQTSRLDQLASIARVASIAREAVACRVCFQSLGVAAPTVDLAQPRWVGPRYWESEPRVLVALLNPGSGEGYNEKSDRELRELLLGFRDGRISLDKVFAHQARDMINWGRGRFLSFYVNGLGLRIDHIAFANIAWCATRGNAYPPAMLSNCFKRFTARLLAVLSPTIVLISGSSAHSYLTPIRRQLQQAKVLPMLHYAHRKGRAAEQKELARIGAELTSD